MAQQTDLVAYHRRLAAEHADDPTTRRCRICHRGHCPTYAEAAALLADAGVQPAVDAVEVRSL